MDYSLRELEEKRNTAKTELNNIVNGEDFDVELAEKAKKEYQKWDNKFNLAIDKRDAEPLKENNNELKSRENMNENIFNSTQNIYTSDTTVDKENDLHIYDYMRAITDKPKGGKEYEIVQNSQTSDGYTLPTEVSRQLIDRLRATNPVISAGAQTAVLEGNDTNWVKIETDPQSYWHTELETESNSSGSFGKVQMKPKTLMSVVEVSRELLQDSENAGEAITKAMVGSLNQSILDATFSGAGTDKEPEGLSTLVTQEETYSGSIGYDNLINGSKILYDNNVSEDNRSFLYSPTSWQSLSSLKDSNGQYIEMPKSIANYKQFTSTGVPNGQTYVGDFSNFVYGYRLNVTIERFNGLSVNKYGSKFLAVIRMDTALTHPNAFVRIQSQ